MERRGMPGEANLLRRSCLFATWRVPSLQSEYSGDVRPSESRVSMPGQNLPYDVDLLKIRSWLGLCRRLRLRLPLISLSLTLVLDSETRRPRVSRVTGNIALLENSRSMRPFAGLSAEARTPNAMHRPTTNVATPTATFQQVPARTLTHVRPSKTSIRRQLTAAIPISDCRQQSSSCCY